MMNRVGSYNGIGWKLQRIRDVLDVSIKTVGNARWYFAYCNGKATGDHYRTFAEFKHAVDSGDFDVSAD